jgi:Fic family protein
MRYFTPPEQVKQEMSDLLDWYREQERAKEHPLIVAATFHHRFVRIHPFDDGNGRMARLLTNMILMKRGYPVALIRRKNRDEYIRGLEQADREEDLSQFIAFAANACEYSLQIHLRAARGEPIDDLDDDIDREIALFKRSLADASGEILASRD